jgi:hypothetical protein
MEEGAIFVITVVVAIAFILFVLVIPSGEQGHDIIPAPQGEQEQGGSWLWLLIIALFAGAAILFFGGG